MHRTGMSHVRIAFAVLPFVLAAALSGCAESQAVRPHEPQSSVVYAPLFDRARVGNPSVPTHAAAAPRAERLRQ